MQGQNDVRRLMEDIKVDSYGIKLMAPKAITHLIKLNAISNITANILKQELLSLGGDAAVARGALTGKTKKTDCLLIGNLAQFNRLYEKLNVQPFGLNALAKELSASLLNYQNDQFVLKAGEFSLKLGRRSLIMGVVNLTPDSFSGDGLYRQAPFAHAVRNIVETVHSMIKDGADMIDVGGESSRPGAKAVSLKEELSRTMPVIQALAKRVNAPISIDTSKPEVAEQALRAGACMVNDITGLSNPRMRKVIARHGCAAVIMHMKGTPRSMQKKPAYGSLMDEIIGFLDNAMREASKDGISRDKLIVDPGIGFGKTLEHNLEILRKLREFKVLGRPILVGPSRKSFIGRILDAGPCERVFGTVSACVTAAGNGAHIVRVHDIKQVKEALAVTNAIQYG